MYICELWTFYCLSLIIEWQDMTRSILFFQVSSKFILWKYVLVSFSVWTQMTCKRSFARRTANSWKRAFCSTAPSFNRSWYHAFTSDPLKLVWNQGAPWTEMTCWLWIQVPPKWRFHIRQRKRWDGFNQTDCEIYNWCTILFGKLVKLQWTNLVHDTRIYSSARATRVPLRKESMKRPSTSSHLDSNVA